MPLLRILCSTVAFHCCEVAVDRSLFNMRAELDILKDPPPAAAALARMVYSLGSIVKGVVLGLHGAGGSGQAGVVKKSVELPVNTE